MTAYNDIPDSDVDAESPIVVTLMTNLRDNPKAAMEGSTDAPVNWHRYNPWLLNLGDGSDGAVSYTVNSAISQMLFQCTTFNINAGVTVTSSTPVIIRATSSITINGTLSANGSDLASYPLGRFGPAIGGGGGGGGNGGSGGTTAYSVGVVRLYGDRGIDSMGGGLGGAPGSAGSNIDTATATQLLLMDSLPFALMGPKGGDGAKGTDGFYDSGVYYGGAGGGGGFGGGPIILIAPTIQLGSASVLQANGGNGSNGSNGDSGVGSPAGDGGGGGGGGGGVIMAIGNTLTFTGGYSYAVSGGSGGTSAGGAGGAGGDGVFAYATIPLVNP